MDAGMHFDVGRWKLDVRRSHSPSSFASGFTLIELILVMLILSIVAALVVPSLRNFGTGRTNKDAADQIVNLTRYARDQAVIQAREYRLNFDPAHAVVWLTMEDGGVYQPPTDDFGKQFNVGQGESISTDAPNHKDGVYVEFRPTGRTDPARIWLTDKMGGTIEVACASATDGYALVPAAEMTR
jgi:type II secretion system protein H